MNAKTPKPEGLAATAAKAGARPSSTQREAAIWVEPLTLTAEHRESLAKWLDDAAIESVRSRLQLVRAEMQHRRKNPPPTIGQQRQHIEAIGTAASALAGLLTNSSSSVRALLSEISHFRLGGNLEWRSLAQRLEMLALGCNDKLREMPEQSRRRAAVFLVAQVAEVAVQAGIRISSSPTARFKLLCDVALEIVNCPGSSEGAIDAYLKSVETASRK